MTVARAERAQLSDLFEEVGPDQPTLCDGWTTRDLAAHLVVREYRPDAGLGILLKPLAGHLDRVQAAYAAKPWPELVRLVRSGPPLYSPFKPLDSVVNLTEFFVHHEDVRRARPEWTPRPPRAERDDALWSSLSRTAKTFFRKSPVGVALRTPDGRRAEAKAGPDGVTLVGEPGELLLYAFGRDAKAVLDFEGPQAAVDAVKGTARGF